MPNGDFLHTGNRTYERGQVVKIKVVPGIDTQTRRSGRACRLRKTLQLHPRTGTAPGSCIGLGIQLHPIRTHGFRSGHGISLGIHEQTHAHEEVLEAALRSYELLLLREVGLLPQLDVQTLTLAALEPVQSYTLVPEGGLRQAHADDRACLTGAQWADLQASLADGSRFTDTLRTCAPLSAALKPMLRTLLHYHCGVRSLRTRQMMVDIQSY